MTLLALLAGLALAEPAPPADCAAFFAAVDIANRDGPACVYRYARRHGAYDEALAWMEHVVATQPDWAHARATLGGLRMDQGDADRAWEDLSAAADALQTQGEVEGEVYARLNLTQLAGRMDRLDDARTQLARAIDVATRAGDDSLVKTVESQRLRTAWRYRLDLDLTLARALALHESLTEEDNYQARIIALHVALQVAMELQRDDVVVRTYKDLIALQRANDDAYAESNTRANALMYASSRPQITPRLFEGTIAEEALEVAELARKGDNPWTVVDALLRAAMFTEDEAAADALVDQAQREGRDLEEPLFVPSLVFNYAMRTAHRRPAAALALIERYQDRRPYGWESTEAKIRFVAHHQLGEIEARDRAAAAYLEAARDHLSSGVDAGRSWRADWDGDFHDLAWVHVEEGRTAEAFAVVESIRANAVRSALDRANAEDALIDDVDLRAGWAAARKAMEEAEEALEYAGEAELSAAQEALDQARAEVSRLEDELMARAPEYAALRRTEPARLADIQARLPEGAVMVSFQMPIAIAALAEPWALVIRRDRIERYPLPATETLESQIRLFAGLRGENPAVAARLYDTLLGKALTEADTRVVLVPEGPLYELPFAALRKTPDGPPLAAEVELVQAPSATLWARWAESAPGPGAVVALADPAFDEAVALAHIAKAPPRLPRAAHEARALAALDAEVRAGEAATEAGWLPEQPRLLHFAAHAVIPPYDPGAAGLLLAAGGEDDGWLSAEDIIGAELNGAVVVLSACQSAGGEAVGAQGPEGLSQAFQQAGASAVIATLWPLRDDHAETFFTAFYRHVGQAETLAEAMRSTQAELAAAGVPPEAWAGVVLIGNPDVALVDEPVATAGPGLAGLGGLGGLGVLVAAAGVGLLRWRGR